VLNLEKSILCFLPVKWAVKSPPSTVTVLQEKKIVLIMNDELWSEKGDLKPKYSIKKQWEIINYL
jgi:hypothetical protein